MLKEEAKGKHFRGGEERDIDCRWVDECVRLEIIKVDYQTKDQVGHPSQDR